MSQQEWKIDPKSATPPVILDPEDVASHRFCFMGEFGYEMVSWIPYLLFLRQKFGTPLRTMGRVGSSVFYYFSDDHIELTEPPGDCWGDIELYRRIALAHPDEELIHPGPEPVNRRNIVIGNCDWRNRDIHARIDTTHYVTPDYSFIRPPHQPERPTAVINNKYFIQWPSTFAEPINFLDRDSLIELSNLLVERGYDVIYNHYVEKTALDKHGIIDDHGIFGAGQAHTHDLREDYARCTSVLDRNRLQLATYNAADLVIGPQGGNLYLPAICRRKLFILMRAGNYIDYRELGRVYGIDVEAFYEPRHLVCWLSQNLPTVGAALGEAA